MENMTNNEAQVYIESLKELLLSLLVATLPLWGLYIAVSINQNNIFNSKIFFELVENGVLFIYAATTLSPILYLVIKDREKGKIFKGKSFFISIVFIISSIATIIISVQRYNNLVLSHDWIKVSIVFFIISIIIMYIALVINNSLTPDPTAEMRDEEESFLNRLKKHRRP